MSTPDRFERARSGENLLGAFAALRRRWVLALSVVVACVAVSVFSHEHKAKSYSATASVAFQSGTLSDSALQVTSGGSGEPQREADTEVLIAHSPEVAQRRARQLAHAGTPPQRTAGRSQGRSRAQRRRPERHRDNGDPR